MYRIVKGVKYRTTSSFLMDQKAKRLNKYKKVKKDVIPEYFKNHISTDSHAVEHRTRALQRHLDRLEFDFAEAAYHATQEQRSKTPSKTLPRTGPTTRPGTRPMSVHRYTPFRESRNSSLGE